MEVVQEMDKNISNLQLNFSETKVKSSVSDLKKQKIILERVL